MTTTTITRRGQECDGNPETWHIRLDEPSGTWALWNGDQFVQGLLLKPFAIQWRDQELSRGQEVSK